MKMINKKSGEAVYFNPVRKAGKDVWVIQGICALTAALKVSIV